MNESVLRACGGPARAAAGPCVRMGAWPRRWSHYPGRALEPFWCPALPLEPFTPDVGGTPQWLQVPCLPRLSCANPSAITWGSIARLTSSMLSKHRLSSVLSGPCASCRYMVTFSGCPTAINPDPQTLHPDPRTLNPTALFVHDYDCFKS